MLKSLWFSYTLYLPPALSVSLRHKTTISMAEEALAPSPVKSPAPATTKAKGSISRRRSTPAHKDSQKTLVTHILEVLAEYKQPKGVSVYAIKKNLKGRGLDVVTLNKRINLAIRRLAQNGEIVQVSGSGASGSFKIPKKEASKSKPKTTRTKSPARKPAVKKDKVKRPRTPKKDGKKNKKPSGKKTANKKVLAKKSPKTPDKKKRAKPSPKKVGKVTAKKQVKIAQKRMAKRKSTASKKTSGKGKK